MDEKTEELRDIFMDVSDDPTVTERQEDERGSLAADRDVDERLREVVASMREEYDFRTDLPDETLLTVLREFFGGESDEAIADAVDATPEEVFLARLDLHLLRDGDAETPLDRSELQDLLVQGLPDGAIAAALDADEGEVQRQRRVVEAETEARRVSQRYRNEFEEILADADLAIRMTETIKEDGLEEATEDMETDVSF